MVHWLKLCASTAGATGSIPGGEVPHTFLGVAKKEKHKEWRRRVTFVDSSPMGLVQAFPRSWCVKGVLLAL